MERILNSTAFVINVHDLAPNRKEFFLPNIRDAGFKEIVIFDGVNGTDDKQVQDALSLFNYPTIEAKVGRSQLGCMLSHMKLLRKIIDEKIEICTIFEDDVSFHPQWKSLAPEYFLKTPKDFDMIYIGNGLDSCRSVKSLKELPKISTEPAWCLHAYIVTLRGAQKVLDSLLNWDYKSFGEPVSGLYVIDIMLIEMQQKMNANLIPRKFIWYSWNGTHYECESNKLPLQGNQTRNSGLVFQNTDLLGSTMVHGYRKHSKIN
jgi:hypothetical protein